MNSENNDVTKATNFRGNTLFYNFLNSLPFPFPFLLLIAAIGYWILIGLICLIYHCARGRKPSPRNPIVRLQPFACCPCCLSIADVCNCCRMTSLDACLNGICPQRKTHDCADLMLCQACLGRPGHLKRSIPLVRCPVLCRSAYCEDTTLCCFYCDFREKPLLETEQ